jgi:DNA replication protein DnaC
MTCATCKHCGAAFEPPSPIEFPGLTIAVHYCGEACRLAAWREYKRQERIERYHRIKGECCDEGLLPPWFHEHIKPLPHQQAHYEAATDNHASCWIYGATGRGKSYMARLIIQYHLANGTRCAFETASKLFNDESKRWKELQRIPVLCIDDAHICAYGHYTATLFHDCMSLREGQRLRTLITCEYPILEFSKRFPAVGHSTIARMDACGRRLDIEVVGDNLRRDA